MSAPDLDHLVLTRFSAVLGSGQPRPEPDWLDYRLGFFIDACLPSMLGQSERDVRWLVWFDDRCDDDFRADVEELAQSAFEPIWTHDLFWSSLQGQVAARAQAPSLVTTRLDNDDAVARDFIESIQREARAAGDVERLVIDFPVGLQLDRTGAVYADHLQSNHFVSLLERRTAEPPFTVFVDAHPKLRRHAPTRRVMTPPMWIEVVHGANVSNDIRGRRTAPDVVAERFELDLDYRRDVPARDLRRERRSRARQLIARRLSDPHAALSWWRSVSDRVRGTRLVPQQTGLTAGERLQRIRRRLRGS